MILLSLLSPGDNFSSRHGVFFKRGRVLKKCGRVFKKDGHVFFKDDGLFMTYGFTPTRRMRFGRNSDGVKG